MKTLFTLSAFVLILGLQSCKKKDTAPAPSENKGGAEISYRDFVIQPSEWTLDQESGKYFSPDYSFQAGDESKTVTGINTFLNSSSESNRLPIESGQYGGKFYSGFSVYDYAYNTHTVRFCFVPSDPLNTIASDVKFQIMITAQKKSN